MPSVDLLQDPAIRAWATASCVVALKTLAVAIYTSTLRMRSGTFISPEDYAMQGIEPKGVPDPAVERARRIHQNDLENGLVFALVGLLYALTQPTTAGLWICFAGFPAARILHSVFYARSLMPHRTVAYTVGFAITVWMSVASLWALVVG